MDLDLNCSGGTKITEDCEETTFNFLFRRDPKPASHFVTPTQKVSKNNKEIELNPTNSKLDQTIREEDFIDILPSCSGNFPPNSTSPNSTISLPPSAILKPVSVVSVLPAVPVLSELPVDPSEPISVIVEDTGPTVSCNLRSVNRAELAAESVCQNTPSSSVRTRGHCGLEECEGCNTEPCGSCYHCLHRRETR